VLFTAFCFIFKVFITLLGVMGMPAHCIRFNSKVLLTIVSSEKGVRGLWLAGTPQQVLPKAYEEAAAEEEFRALHEGHGLQYAWKSRCCLIAPWSC
jgi:hypothetical protein